MNTIERAIVYLALFISIFCFSLVVVKSQMVENNVYELSPKFIVVGYQFKFNNGWSEEISGKLYPINKSAFIIEWYKYNDTVPLKNDTFVNHRATSYEVDLRVYTYSNNTKFQGVFYVMWYGGEYIIKVESTSGYLVIRDRFRDARLYSEILRARKYQYQVGDMK